MQVTQVVQAFESLGNSSRERTGMSCFVPEQLRRFTKETLRARPVRPFDVQEVLRRIHLCKGMTVLAVDIGGDKITAADFSVLHGRVELSNHVLTVQGDNGVGYLAALREVADSAQRRGIPVGISFAGPISGTRLNAAPNMPFFAKELQAGYGGDFANLFWKLELANDAEAGIMIRESLAANAKMVGIFLTPTNGVRVLSRATTNADIVKQEVKNITAPHWVKLVRSGDTFTGYESYDGVKWTQVGKSVTVAMATPCYVGLAVCSHKPGVLNTAKFDNVSVV